jgi:sec-independent protein translocase protein TatC
MAATVAAPRGRHMPVAGHVREARTRTMRAALALVAAAVAGYLLSDPILDVLRAPVLELADSRDASLNYDSVTGAFDLRLRIALLAGVVLSAPVWLYELLAYVAPGLTRRERRHALGFLLSALPLFAAGCAAGLLVFPHMVEVLAGFAAAEDSTLLSASSYFDFVMKVVLGTGVAFTLPVLVVMLNFLGIVSASTLGRGWRLCVVAIIVVSALVTPAADVLSMFLIAVPMTALFFGAYLVARIHDRAVARRAAAPEGGA